MYPISNAVKALFDAEQRQVLRITGTDRNGAPIAITEANVMEGGFNIDRFSCNGTKLEIGTAISAEMTLKLDNRQGQFNGIIFEGVELFVEIGIADWTQSEPTITYIPCGYFTPDEQPRSLSIITIHALDRMMRFEEVYQGVAPWTDESDTIIKDESSVVITFSHELSFPSTVANLVSQVCTSCGVSISASASIQSLPNAGFVVEGMPESEQTITFRNLIQWCAGIMGTNAWIDWEGKLRFSWYNNITGYVTTTEKIFSSDIFENDVSITGVTYSKDADNVYLVGTEIYTLDLSNNYLLYGISDTGIASILQSIYTVVNNYAYRPFTASIINAPWLYPMDVISVTDANGTGHAALLTNVNHGINGSTSLKGIGESDQTNSYAVPNSMTPDQNKALSRYMQAANSQMEAAIANATNQITGATNSNVRFVYDANGHLTEILVMDTDDISTAVNVWRWNSGGLGHSNNGYNGPYSLALTQDGSIVATMITSGILNASVLKAGIIQDTAGLNYWNLETGDFQLSANTHVGDTNNTIGKTVVSTVKQYYLSTSYSTPEGGWWSLIQPLWVNGRYYWERTKFVYSDGTEDYSTPRIAIGLTSGNQSTDNLDSALNQQGVFNRLTNNGQTQGIYLSNGKLYINGTYIQAGTINADLLRAGVIQDVSGTSYWNLISGVMNFEGTFSASKSTTEGIFKMELDDGGLKLFLDNTLVASLGWNDGGITLEGTNNHSSTIAAYDVDVNDDVIGGSAVTTNDDGEIRLLANDIAIQSYDSSGNLSLPVYGLNGTYTIGGSTVTITNGLITDIS